MKNGGNTKHICFLRNCVEDLPTGHFKGVQHIYAKINNRAHRDLYMYKEMKKDQLLIFNTILNTNKTVKRKTQNPNGNQSVEGSQFNILDPQRLGMNIDIFVYFDNIQNR